MIFSNWMQDMADMGQPGFNQGICAFSARNLNNLLALLAVGAVENGYRFKGGDPRETRENWEQVKK